MDSEFFIDFRYLQIQFTRQWRLCIAVPEVTSQIQVPEAEVNVTSLEDLTCRLEGLGYRLMSLNLRELIQMSFFEGQMTWPLVFCTNILFRQGDLCKFQNFYLTLNAQIKLKLEFSRIIFTKP